MNELQLIKSERFGEIEADIYSNGNDMFMTINQLAGCLEYADKSGVEKIVERNPYLKKPEFSTTDNLSVVEGGRMVNRERMIFTEDGIYEVTMLSGQPKAKEFRAWIRGILKALRKGTLKMPADDPVAKLRASAMKQNATNRTAKFMLMQMEAAGIDPKHRLISLAEMYNKEGIAVSLPPMEVEEKTYDLTEMAAALGMLSKSGKPHAQAIGIIVAKVKPADSECVLVPYQRNGHSAESTRYKESVLNRVEEWLELHKYPAALFGKDQKKYTITYREAHSA